MSTGQFVWKEAVFSKPIELEIGEEELTVIRKGKNNTIKYSDISAVYMGEAWGDCQFELVTHLGEETSFWIKREGMMGGYDSSSGWQAVTALLRKLDRVNGNVPAFVGNRARSMEKWFAFAIWLLVTSAFIHQALVTPIDLPLLVSIAIALVASCLVVLVFWWQYKQWYRLDEYSLEELTEFMEQA